MWESEGGVVEAYEAVHILSKREVAEAYPLLLRTPSYVKMCIMGIFLTGVGGGRYQMCQAASHFLMVNGSGRREWWSHDRTMCSQHGVRRRPRVQWARQAVRQNLGNRARRQHISRW